MAAKKTKQDAKRPDFSRNMRLGYRDRGLGHGDYGVVTEDERLLAEVKSMDLCDGTRLPDKANAHLFAAAPELFAACEAALKTLQRVGGHRKVAAKLTAALKKAVPAG